MNPTTVKRSSTVLGAVLLGGVSVAAAAQSYPVKPVRLIVGFSPAGPNDIIARALGQKMGEQSGYQIVVENRAGANTAIATELVARAAPDGHTLMFVSPGHATNPSLMKLNFDPIRDFAFVTQVADTQNLVVVHPSLPVHNIKELIAFAKSRPGQVNYGSSGVGSTSHLSGELLQIMTGVKIVHIPYKGAGPALVELLAGQHVLYFANVAGVIAYVRSKRMRGIAVTGEKRSPAAPDIPTAVESGLPGFVVTAWYAMAAPAKTPRALIDKLNTDTARALKSPDLTARLLDQGAEVVGGTPEQATAFVQNEIAKWAKVIKAAGIRGE